MSSHAPRLSDQGTYTMQSHGVNRGKVSWLVVYCIMHMQQLYGQRSQHGTGDSMYDFTVEFYDAEQRKVAECRRSELQDALIYWGYETADEDD